MFCAIAFVALLGVHLGTLFSAKESFGLVLLLRVQGGYLLIISFLTSLFFFEPWNGTEHLLTIYFIARFLVHDKN